MTAEIAIMNRQAVALAADSAVTIETGSGLKIYNTVNKLFALSKYHPVGVMVYGRADLMGVPWESVIKLYRAHLGKRGFDTLPQYVESFLQFVGNAANLFPKEVQTRYFLLAVRKLFHSLRREIEKKVETRIAGQPLSPTDLQDIVEKEIEAFHAWVVGHPFLPRFAKRRPTNLVARHRAAIKEAQRDIFEKLPLSRTAIKKLDDVPVGWLFRDWFPLTPAGVVIAGFGQNDVFPEVIELHVSDVLEGILKSKRQRQRRITHDNTACIIPFAQREMVYAFMEGVDPGYHTAVDTYLAKMFEMYPTELLKSISELDKTKKAKLIPELQDIGKKVLDEFRANLKEYRRVTHSGPVMDAIDVLPKDVLAEVAESLVNLTSFKRRVSMTSPETVGGPIDVAVISRGDGFVWIKRKHYFRPELNHQFFSNYYVRGGPDAASNQKAKIRNTRTRRGQDPR